MSEKPKQKERIESKHDVGEPETKRRDRIGAQCQRTRNKRKGSNLGAMPENPKQKEGIELGRDAREPEKKKEGIESGRDAGVIETKGRDRTCPKAQRIGYALV